MTLRIAASLAVAILALPVAGRAQAPAPSPTRLEDQPPPSGDIAVHWAAPRTDYDYDRREVMIPMRDGARLHTVIVVPHGAHGLPMLLERTPYDANFFVKKEIPHLRDAAWSADRAWIDDGYILVFQDVRGKYGSDGAYTMTRPPIGPFNPSKTDDTTDAWDTTDWLSKHVPESNGRVGEIGSSYDGWTVTMALLGPHPALRVAAPESPMIDGWMGDDWFHYGAFRQTNLDYIAGQTSVKGKGDPVPRTASDDYQAFLDAGSTGAYAVAHGFDQLPFWRRLAAHPAYDAFWQAQALDHLVAAHPPAVPTMWLQGLWDQEDMYGAIHTWDALRAVNATANAHLVMGPWYHSQVNRSADALGPLKWKGDTAADFRRDVLVPFFDTYLKDRAPAHLTPKVLIYDPGENHWDSMADWPLVAPAALTPYFFQPAGGLSTADPGTGEDSYVSDPAKPIPFEPLPARFGDHAAWTTWLVQDQRTASTRPDVLTYRTPVLDHPIRFAGAPVADLFVRTTGTDADFVVKIIDLYPPTDPAEPEMGGYQLPISLDIFRGRYRKSFEHPSPIQAGQVQEYRFRLPTLNYTLQPGHRLMVQVQSTLFPLYDRNPQTYVPNILFARPADYRPATMTVERGTGGRSAVLLPVVHAAPAPG